MDNFEEQNKRIAAVFGMDKVPRVNRKTMQLYLEHLRRKITLPCQLTGSEDFYWEEFYVLGPGDPVEYEKLKENKPSYTDTFALIGFEDIMHEHYGILAKVKRIIGKNKKHFTIALDQLTCTNKSSDNKQFINDYAVWFANW